MPKLAPGFRVEGYTVVSHAATGGMSEVYEVRHVESGEQAALKLLLADWCSDDELKTRFHNEAIRLGEMNHSRIIALLGHGVLSEGDPYMILEWLPRSLEQVLFESGGALQATSAIKVATQIAAGLAALHERGVVHRDLKPANVLLEQGDIDVAAIKVADLGFAKTIVELATDPSQPGAASRAAVLPISTGGSEVLGSPDYMAPEQWIKSKDADRKADVYALGVLLFQMLAGELPFLGEWEQDLMRLHLFEPPPLHSLEGLAPPALVSLVGEMLSKKPAARPTMREVQERLAGIGG